MKKDKRVDNYNVSFRIRRALERAQSISEVLYLDEINTLSVFLGLAFDEGSVINELYFESGVAFRPDAILGSLISVKELYTNLIGKEFPADNEKEETNENEEETNNIISLEDMIQCILNRIAEEEQVQFTDYYDMVNVPYSKNLQEAILDAGERCTAAGQDYIDEENFLYSLFNMKEDNSTKRFISYLKDSLTETSGSEVAVDIIDLIDLLLSKNIHFSTSSNKPLVIPKPLENCCEILNDKYEPGCKCDILGRDDEIFKVWGILSKKQKSNVVLLGEAGVGKSAIVEALTMQIVNGSCPSQFYGYSIVLLNVVGMVAGTKYRGEFEKKVEHLVKFIENNDKVIVFVDEIHQIMGAGSAEGGLDLSGSLKPLLARDKIKFIGATTMAEYRAYICRDNAFRRRLEPVVVKEPKQSEVLAMLEVKIKNLKKFHKMRITKDVLHYIQVCASCFNTTTCNPDKTLDLIDRAMAVAKMMGKKSVSIRHVEDVYKENYEKLDRLSNSYKLSTAYHEAGHFVAHMLYKDVLVDQEVFAVSIVPGFDFMGVNIIESTENCAEGTIEYYKALIGTLLAGRIAEEFYSKTLSSGASNDLGRATSIAKDMIIRCGLSTGEFVNVSVYDVHAGNDLPLSDNIVDTVTKEANNIVRGVYEEFQKLLETHKDKVKFIAEELINKKIIEASNYGYLFEEK